MKYSLIESCGLRLRALEPEDTLMVYEAENDRANIDYNGYLAPYSRQQLMEYALTYNADPMVSRQLRLICEEIDGGNPIGIIDFTEMDFRARVAFIGVYVMADMRRRGWSSKMIKAAIAYAKRVYRIDRFGAKAAADNEASIRMLHKAGFKDIGRMASWLYSPASQCNVDMLLMELHIPD